MKNKYFGTDGIRGRVGDTPVTADFMLRLGRAAGKVLADGDSRSVVIGKDTRISGYMFESALEAGLAAAGADVALLGPMPTPAVAYLTRTLHACAGIVISASHNPFYDNGIKFFSADGEKLPDEVEQAIEAELAQPFSTVSSEKMGKAVRIDDAAGRYIEFCKGTIPFEIMFRGIKIVVDCAHGATYRVAPAVLEELGADVITVGVEPDGLNINEGCGSTNPELLSQAVLENEADIGIALDGDGDRVIMVDHRGEVVNGDELLYIIATARQDEGILQGGVIGTVMSNFGLELALKERNIPFMRAPVGDRYVHKALVDNSWTLGGEASGHLLCLDRTSTGDGIVSALQVLEVMVSRGKTLAELTSDIQKLPQVMINIPVSGGVSDMDESEPIKSAVQSVENQLGETGRVILRASGTEPLIRVTLEGVNEDQVNQLAVELADVVRVELAH
ncbi:MAG: phosphoglucosamine mutase [Gammaproteobacteria bacterium]|nr:phosphoglucosamine mutase [Gammaproteobacteria bacterium]